MRSKLIYKPSFGALAYQMFIAFIITLIAEYFLRFNSILIYFFPFIVPPINLIISIIKGYIYKVYCEEDSITFFVLTVHGKRNYEITQKSQLKLITVPSRSRPLPYNLIFQTKDGRFVLDDSFNGWTEEKLLEIYNYAQSNFPEEIAY